MSDTEPATEVVDDKSASVEEHVGSINEAPDGNAESDVLSPQAAPVAVTPLEVSNDNDEENTTIPTTATNEMPASSHVNNGNILEQASTNATYLETPKDYEDDSTPTVIDDALVAADVMIEVVGNQTGTDSKPTESLDNATEATIESNEVEDKEMVTDGVVDTDKTAEIDVPMDETPESKTLKDKTSELEAFTDEAIELEPSIEEVSASNLVSDEAPELKTSNDNTAESKIFVDEVPAPAPSMDEGFESKAMVDEVLEPNTSKDEVPVSELPLDEDLELRTNMDETLEPNLPTDEAYVHKNVTAIDNNKNTDEPTTNNFNDTSDKAELDALKNVEMEKNDVVDVNDTTKQDSLEDADMIKNDAIDVNNTADFNVPMDNNSVYTIGSTTENDNHSDESITDETTGPLTYPNSAKYSGSVTNVDNTPMNNLTSEATPATMVGSDERTNNEISNIPSTSPSAAGFAKSNSPQNTYNDDNLVSFEDFVKFRERMKSLASTRSTSQDRNDLHQYSTWNDNDINRSNGNSPSTATNDYLDNDRGDISPMATSFQSIAQPSSLQSSSAQGNHRESAHREKDIIEILSSDSEDDTHFLKLAKASLDKKRKRDLLANNYKPTEASQYALANYQENSLDCMPRATKPEADSDSTSQQNKKGNPIKVGQGVTAPAQTNSPFVSNVSPAEPFQPSLEGIQSRIDQLKAVLSRTMGSAAAAAAAAAVAPAATTQSSRAGLSRNNPFYINWPSGFNPSWERILPIIPQSPATPDNSRKSYQLSLLNVNEFTITGLAIGYGGTIPTPTTGLRPIIKQIARGHGGTAVFQHDDESDGGEGRWRISLSAYQAIFTYLKSDPNVHVIGIPDVQLKIASLERSRQEKDYPSEEYLVEKGVPKGLATTLAPFQRGGVDFVHFKNGKALIADDMGLGKTIQSIASMTMYYDEWPLLVLTPSSARYHWEAEFNHWLGMNSAINEKKADRDDKLFYDKNCQHLLRKDQIHVLNSSKDVLLPSSSTKVVICSYGLAPTLVEMKKLYAGLFRCAIVDESHMLKNKAAKRTAALMPVLSAADRCILLSGTPALARPAELWPQLYILGASQHEVWSNESEYYERYVRSRILARRAELHALLTGTIMIRRLKQDILKTLPSKIREKASIRVLNDENRKIFQSLMFILRDSNGALGKIARKHEDEMTDILNVSHPADPDLAAGPSLEMLPNKKAAVTKTSIINNLYDIAVQELKIEVEQRLESGRNNIAEGIEASDLSSEEKLRCKEDLEKNLQAEVESYCQEQLSQLNNKYGRNDSTKDKYDDVDKSSLQDLYDYKTRNQQDCLKTINQFKKDDMLETEQSRATFLARLYSLTGEVKIPIVVDMLKRWLNDHTKGKLCIFAHHISVLDAILDLSGLSNRKGSRNKYIRIDGSTTPRFRQDQIVAFQSDPSYRIALLGITAAGVAVTLTAASTVWFAELFWTPAIMIQAEDRCHRIGQQARVKCLYFVARGTLDDVLWRLIDQKFQDLGEFVEGRENQKIIVDKEYTSMKELRSIFSTEENNTDSDVDDSDSDVMSVDDKLEVSGDILAEIEKLGQQEASELFGKFTDQDGEDDRSDESDRKMPAIQSKKPDVVIAKATGASIHDAIALSDDSDDDEKPAAKIQGQAGVKTDTPLTKSDRPPLGKGILYKILADGPTMGFEVILYYDRVVACHTTDDRKSKYGSDCKPHFGDVLVGINGHALPLVNDVAYVAQIIQKAMTTPPVELTFLEDEVFAKHFKDYLESQKQLRKKRRKERTLATIQENKLVPEEIIELLDD